MHSVTTPLRAAIYTRVSDPGQEEGHGLDYQRDACLRYAAERGYHVAEVYQEVLTGSLMDERPVLTRLRRTIARREVDRVVVWRFDRLSRDPDDRVYLRVEASKQGVAFESVTDPVADTDEGRLVEYIAGYAAKLERKSIILRTQAGLNKRVEGGARLTGHKAPYGYRFAGDKKERLEEDPATAVVLRRIFHEAATGTGLRRIAINLTRDGIPTPNPARKRPDTPAGWHHRSLHNMLRNPVYKGEAYAFRKRTTAPKAGGTHKTSTTMRPPEEWVRLPDGTVPALVTADVWEAVQRRLDSGQRRSERSAAPKKDTLLRTYVRCGMCGAAMQVNRTPKVLNYRCGAEKRNPGCGKQGHSIRAGWLDAQVWAAVEAFLSEPGVVLADRRYAAAHDATAADLARLEAAVKQVRQQEANLGNAIAMLAPGSAALPGLVAKLEGLAAQRRALGAEKGEVQLAAWARQAAAAQLDSLRAWCQTVRATAASLDYDGKREVLERLGVKVEVHRQGDFRGRFTITMAPEGYTLADAKGVGVPGYWEALGVAAPATTAFTTVAPGRMGSGRTSGTRCCCSKDGSYAPAASRSTCGRGAGRSTGTGATRDTTT